MIKRKIKIITCHDVYNAGASLQAYALQKYLLNLGHDVETIDYKPWYLSQHYYLWNINPKFSKNIFLKIIYLMIKLPKRLLRKLEKRKRAYDKFKRKYLHLTRRYKNNDELKKDLPIADIYIAGSDQIWNPMFENGKDPAFYLDFVPKGKVKVSYAASISVEEYPEEIIFSIRKWLSSFNDISVREKSALELLEGIGIHNVQNVLDPVFLLDKEEWIELSKVQNSKAHYVLVYDFDHNEEIKRTAYYISKVKNIKIYSILPCEYASKNFTDLGPREFISLINNADYIVSNSFHATAFSIILQKEFYVFNREWKINTRMRDLVVTFGLRERLIDRTPLELQNIDWNKIKETCIQNINESKKFIENFMKGN